RRPAAMRCRGDRERCGDTPDPIAAGRRSHRVAARLSRLSLDLQCAPTIMAAALMRGVDVTVMTHSSG
ncbi:hypothetical protein, partial [Lamprocystis purpurea]|uniref:hypothetical protein n=1 Tax=Lamprocystis purpurea TaxID=61598 RepID=UPI001B7FB3F2